jgi:hypothetical protein
MRSNPCALAFVGLIVWFSGCGAPEEDDEVVSTEATAGSGPTCRSFSLTASKRYNPTRFADGSLSFAPAFNLAIPSRIPVKAGKAGNSDHRLTLKITSGSSTQTCTYRGAGSGTRYGFSSCTGGLSVGAAILADRVVLHVVDGDHNAGTTTVRLDAKEAAPCNGPPPPLKLFTIANDADQFSTLEQIGLNGSVQPLFGLGFRFTGLASPPGDSGFYSIATDATGFSTLMRIDLNGAVQERFGVGIGFTGGLTFNPDTGLLYAVSCDATSFCTIQSINLNGQVLPLFGVGFRFSGLTYDAEAHRFLAMASDSSGFSTLTSIMLNGAVTPLFGVGFRFTGGLAQDPADSAHFFAISSDTMGFSTLQSIELAGTIQPLFGVGFRFANGALVVK